MKDVSALKQKFKLQIKTDETNSKKIEFYLNFQLTK